MTENENIDTLTQWLVTEARFLNDGVILVDELGNRLVKAGIPISRMRIAQRFANPLLAAWGVIWRPNQHAEDYVVATKTLSTDVWIGSPFQYVSENRRSLRQRLSGLTTGIEHHVFYELAEQGGTDFYAMPLEYGDGTVQGMSIVTNHPDGFTDQHLETLEAMRHPLALVMEPIAARRSLSSLLKTYLGKGPASAVANGAIHQGDVTRIEAIIMMNDMRNFTQKSTEWTEEELLKSLSRYFEIIVTAVHNHNGEILKFIGDGVLSVFPIKNGLPAKAQAENAIAAAFDARTALENWNTERKAIGLSEIEFGTGVHLGEVIYGNVGSPDRLDFTVIGDAVNVASRIENMTKETGKPFLCSSAVAGLATEKTREIGEYSIRGLMGKVKLFTWTAEAENKM
ncbi:MAG: adenylate/guanylate cyclase domain-containing protein [Pseudomonadota bacterium]